jgi:hypothetical protein
VAKTLNPLLSDRDGGEMMVCNLILARSEEGRRRLARSDRQS